MKNDNDLVLEINTQKSNEALAELAKRHSRLFFSVLKKYFKPASQEFCDIEKSLLYIIHESAKSFNPQKGTKFSTWFANQVRFYCLNFKTPKQSREVQMDDEIFNFIINITSNKDCLHKKEDLIEDIKEALNSISDENIKKVIYYRYFSGPKVLNYSEIGQRMNVTAQTVLNWHNKFISKAKKKLLTNS